MSEPLLVLSDVHAFYGNVPSLFGVGFEVGPGEVVALLGANGAGKSTTLRAISGVIRSHGNISFAGRRIDGRAPDEIARLGIAHVPEGRGLFRSLTVRENLRTGTFVATPGSDVARETERVYELFPVLRKRASQQAGTLSGGEQQMLAIGRALVSRPTLLMVDELSLGLAPALVEGLFDVIPKLAEAGMAVLLVEQFVSQALRVADRAAVLERGRVSWFGTAKALARRKGFVEASYLGARPIGNGSRALPDGDAFVERVAVPLPARALRALQREAAASRRSVEELLAERLRADEEAEAP